MRAVHQQEISAHPAAEPADDPVVLSAEVVDAKAPAPRDRPPASFRPDRPEVMNPVGSGSNFELARGIVFECLVGAHNQARNLATGIVTFAPGTELGYRRCFTVSLTVLEGSVVVEIEGRAHPLELLDNVVIPRGLWHGVKNASADGNALLHIAMPTSSPADELLEKPFSQRLVPTRWRANAPAHLPERVNGYKTAERFQAGANATFINFFNDDIMPGIKMSGGYGLFQPEGRLPAHVHDFDESICIIQGVATCVVEGRTYSMTGNSTALQPRGRVHYFINHSSGPMAMVWVYAGPKPQRLVVNERCATVEGNPWK